MKNVVIEFLEKRINFKKHNVGDILIKMKVTVDNYSFILTEKVIKVNSNGITYKTYVDTSILNKFNRLFRGGLIPSFTKLELKDIKIILDNAAMVVFEDNASSVYSALKELGLKGLKGFEDNEYQIPENSTEAKSWRFNKQHFINSANVFTSFNVSTNN